MSSFHPFTIFPLGDSALLVEFGDEASQEVHDRVLALRNAIAVRKLANITAMVPAQCSLAVRYNVALTVRNETTAFEEVARMIEEIAAV